MIKKMKMISLLLSLIIVFPVAHAMERDEDDEHLLLNNTHHLQNDTLKILFIGSSYFNYNNLADLFENIANTIVLR